MGQETTIGKNANNKRKWESDHSRDSGEQQSKHNEVVRAHAIGQAARKRMLGNCLIATGIVRLPLLQRVREPMWQIKKLPSLVMNVEGKDISGMNARS
ncbi:hypothetical protein Tco_1488481 [Tanacetum coccineum]